MPVSAESEIQTSEFSGHKVISHAIAIRVLPERLNVGLKILHLLAQQPETVDPQEQL